MTITNNHYLQIAKLKRSLQKQKLKGIAVDIDETLSFTLKYWFSELARLFGNPENLTIDQLIKKYRYAKNVPYWQTAEALEWMEASRESNELQTKLEVIDNADKYLREVTKIIPVAAYITIRPESVVAGTESWLSAHNFPDAPVIARPAYVSHSTGNPWKAALLEYLYPEVTGMIDDNFEVLDYLSHNYLGDFFLYSMKEYTKAGPRIYCCPKWPDVLSQLKKTY